MKNNFETFLKVATTHCLKWAVFAMVCFAVMACKDDEDGDSMPGPEAPVISSFSPESGYPGSLITIKGHHFGDNTENVTVRIGNFEAMVLKANDTQIQAVIPQDAFSGRHKVQVIMPEREAAESTEGFRVLFISGTTFAGLYPTSGQAGDTIHILGGMFNGNFFEVGATIGGKPATVLSKSRETVMITVPAEAPVGKSKPTLILKGKELVSPVSFEVLPINSDPAFTLNGFTPSKGEPWDTLWIQGKGFSKRRYTTRVSVGGHPARLVAVEDETIIALVPEDLEPGMKKIAVSDGLHSLESPGDFKVLDCKGFSIRIEPNTLGFKVITTGGTPPFQFSLDGGPYTTTDTFEGLDIANYTLKAKDAEGCRQTVGVPASSIAIFKDTDGQTYRLVKIGEQIWMAENYKSFPSNSLQGSVWCFDDRNINCHNYGYLYTHAAALIVVPHGWRLPTVADAEILLNHLGSNAYNRMLPEGDSGFEAGLFGYRHNTGSYIFHDTETQFWLEDGTDLITLKRTLALRKFSGNQVTISSENYRAGLSVRLIKE